jgi:hypothetical protein
MQIDFDHGDSGIEVLCLIYHTPKSWIKKGKLFILSSMHDALLLLLAIRFSFSKYE